MDRVATRTISRRAAVALGLALPLAIAPGAARSVSPVVPMRQAEMRDLLRIYNEARKAVAIQTDRATIARIIAERDVAASKIMAESGGAFRDWLATAKVVKPHVTGRWLGYRVELVPDTGLQTYIGDDDAQTATMIPINDPLADAAQALRDRLVRVSGKIQLNGRLPVDVLATSSKAGQEVSLLAKFTEIAKAI